MPAVLKTRRLGYDGKGQRVVRGRGRGRDRMGGAGRRALHLLEGFVRFARELSCLAVRGRDGTVAVLSAGREPARGTASCAARSLRRRV